MSFFYGNHIHFLFSFLYTVVKSRKQSKVDEKQEYLDNSF